jgi:phenylpropionate dioxygenase-like ring-hydroxylating dioxygenase large terminal subunit
MITGQWYVVLDSLQVKDRPVGVTRMGEKLVFWRDASGKAACFRDRCAHRGIELSKGKVIGDHLQCPFHGLEYDLSGKVTVIPAEGRKTPVPDRFRAMGYPVHEERGLIWIWWGENPPADLKPPAFFTDIDSQFSFSWAYDHWNAHYSRVIENQLDAAHLPFIHHNTIGRGNRTIIDGPLVRWLGADQFEVYVHNRVEDGTAPVKPEQFPPPDPEHGVKLEFIFPNLWQNHINEKVRILAAFIPVDRDNTILYLRFYQKFLRTPLLRGLVTRLAMPFNLVVAHQDRRVVVTHQPRVSGLQIGEQLFPADRPIVEYRRRRQELMEKAGSRTP